jgi:hypothetical protein
MEHPQSDYPIAAISGHSPVQIVQALRQQIARLEQARVPSGETPISCGCEALDRLLPERGFRRGTLVEWLAAGVGSGAETLALSTAREACREGGTLVVLDYLREFYPPAAVRLGIAPDAMIVIHALSEADNLWALDQSLRCLGVAAVLAWPENLDSHTFRRLQLAAEQGGGLGLLVRSERVQHEPSWADVRLLVEPLSQDSASGGWRRLRVQVLRTHGGSREESIEVEVDDETRAMCLAPRLAHPTNHRRAAGS